MYTKEERFAYIGIGGKQYAYWLFLESKAVSIKVMMANFEPLPEIFVGVN